MKIKLINKSNNEIPSYATIGSAGMDIRAHIVEGKITLAPMERYMIPTGLFIELPEGYEAQIRPRSGLAIKSGITVINTPGTIDHDYRGEVCVLLINLSTEDYHIYNGDRIAQMIINKYEKAEFELVDTLSETERGEGGFGHTKIK